MILHPVEHLTSNYRKDEESNNYKLLSLGHHEHMEILDSLSKIEAYRDIDEAAGFTLDKAGKNVLELRGVRDDETFRRAIKIKIRSNLSAGTIEDINTISNILFGENFISVQETWSEDEWNYEPAAMLLSLLDNPEAQAMFFEYIKNIVMSIKAGGVRLYNRIQSSIPDSKLHIGTSMSADSSCMVIPTRTLENMSFTNTLGFAGLIFNDFSYMEIPTAELREVDRD